MAASPGSLQSIERAWWSRGALAHALLPLAWCFGLLAATRRALYRIGLRALLVGTSYIDTDEVVAGARSALDRLAEQTGETCHLARLDGSDVAYRARCRPPSFIHFSLFPELIRGHTLSDVVAVLGSLNIIAAELDR